ncbi:hypothetical protein [Paenibacillus sp. MMO-177]|uniref:hypothetical protein n=1 Tax=Paenibacillus sp. MMO-177 TaxID=3081289 RepID=UPI0030183164
MKIIMSLLVATLLTSCSNTVVNKNNEFTPIVSTEAPPKIHESSENTSSVKSKLSAADLSIEGIRIGGSIDDVVKAYGQPSEKTVSHGVGTAYWIFKEQGIAIDFGGPIWQITVTSPFEGSTSSGISIGDTTEEILEVYPDIKKGDSYILKSADGQYSIQFSIENEKVAQITMSLNPASLSSIEGPVSSPTVDVHLDESNYTGEELELVKVINTSTRYLNARDEKNYLALTSKDSLITQLNPKLITKMIFKEFGPITNTSATVRVESWRETDYSIIRTYTFVSHIRKIF